MPSSIEEASRSAKLVLEGEEDKRRNPAYSALFSEDVKEDRSQRVRSDLSCVYYRTFSSLSFSDASYH
jgi:hypothetical protein